MCACACARVHPDESAQYLEINLSSGHLLIQIFPMAGNLLSPGGESDSTGLMASKSSVENDTRASFKKKCGASFIPKLPKSEVSTLFKFKMEPKNGTLE